MKSFSKGVRGKRREKKATEKSRREGESGGPLRFPSFSTCFFSPCFVHSSPPFRPLSLSPLPPSLRLSRTPRNKTKKHQGGFQYWLYNIKFTKLCAPLTARFGHAAVAPIKVFLDQGIHHPLLYLHIHDADDHGQGEEIGRCEVNIDFLAKEHHHHFKEKVLHGGQECGKIEFDVAWEDTTQLVEGPLDA